jgi:hypothetical protein
VIDPAKVVSEITHAPTRDIIEPIVYAMWTGALDDSGDSVARQLSAFTRDELMVIAGHALIFGAAHAVYSRQLSDLIDESLA